MCLEYVLGTTVVSVSFNGFGLRHLRLFDCNNN